jgi:O-antigen ligase
MAYAPIFAGLMLLWPVLAFLGGQGFSPLIGLCAIAGLAFVRPTAPVRIYGVAGLAFAGWAALSTLWTPAGGPLVTGSVWQGDFGLNAPAARLVLMALAITIVFMAISRVPAASAPKSRLALVTAFSLAGLMLLISALFLKPLLALAYDSPQEAMTAGMQNALRQANAFSIALPVLLAMIWASAGNRLMRLFAVSIGLGAGVIFTYFGGTAALMALVFATIAMGVVKWLPERGFLALAGVWASVIATAPLTFANMARFLSATGLPAPFSFHSRAYAWHSVGEQVAQRPLTGHGLEAAETWDATYSSQPGWLSEIVANGGNEQAWSQYRIVPGHPHNMPLEIWAETGLVGAALGVFAVLALGARLPAPRRLAAEARFAAAGVIGAALSLFSFSYSMWNEAGWAIVALAGASALLLQRQGGRPG